MKGLLEPPICSRLVRSMGGNLGLQLEVEGGLMGLRLKTVGSDAISRRIVSESSCILGHSAGVQEFLPTKWNWVPEPKISLNALEQNLRKSLQ